MCSEALGERVAPSLEAESYDFLITISDCSPHLEDTQLVLLESSPHLVEGDLLLSEEPSPEDLMN